MASLADEESMPAIAGELKAQSERVRELKAALEATRSTLGGGRVAAGSDRGARAGRAGGWALAADVRSRSSETFAIRGLVHCGTDIPATGRANRRVWIVQGQART